MSAIKQIPNRYLKRDEKPMRTFLGSDHVKVATEKEQREHCKVSTVRRAGKMLHLCSIFPMLPALESIREGCRGADGMGLRHSLEVLYLVS